MRIIASAPFCLAVQLTPYRFAPFRPSSCAVACMLVPLGRCWRIKPFVPQALQSYIRPWGERIALVSSRRIRSAP